MIFDNWGFFALFLHLFDQTIGFNFEFRCKLFIGLVFEDESKINIVLVFASSQLYILERVLFRLDVAAVAKIVEVHHIFGKLERNEMFNN